MEPYRFKIFIDHERRVLTVRVIGLMPSAEFVDRLFEAYGRIEAPKGELCFYVISDGSTNPYRYRVRPPSFINLTVLEDMCLGQSIADAVIILGSVDIVLGEVDR